MTIVEKVINLLNADKEMCLNEIYEKIPEHSKASIRGNINRYLLKSKSPKFQRIEKGVYAVIEIFNITENKDGTKNIDYISSFYSNDKEVHYFHKSFQFTGDIKTGFYHQTDEFKNYDELLNSYNDIRSILLKGDVKELLLRLKSESVDCIITDPPYKKIKGGKNGKNSPKGILKENDGKIFEYNDIEFDDWIPECYRILKDNSHAYFFTDFTNLQKIMVSIEKAGFYIHNLLVWLKNNATPNRYYMKNCEYILFCKKGKAKTINHPGSKTVLSYDNILGNKIHPSEKPIDLLTELILNSTNENDIIFDPFSGSESTATSAVLNNRKSISIDIDSKYTSNRIERLCYALFNHIDIVSDRRNNKNNKNSKEKQNIVNFDDTQLSFNF